MAPAEWEQKIEKGREGKLYVWVVMTKQSTHELQIAEKTDNNILKHRHHCTLNIFQVCCSASSGFKILLCAINNSSWNPPWYLHLPWKDKHEPGNKKRDKLSFSLVLQ